MSVQSSVVSENMAEGGASIGHLLDDEEGQTHLFMFSDCLHLGYRAIASALILNCHVRLCCVSRWECAGEQGIRGCVSNRPVV